MAYLKNKINHLVNMPSKKQKESVPSSSEAEEEDYDSEDMQESSDDANLGDG